MLQKSLRAQILALLSGSLLAVLLIALACLNEYMTKKPLGEAAGFSAIQPVGHQPPAQRRNHSGDGHARLLA